MGHSSDTSQVLTSSAGNLTLDPRSYETRLQNDGVYRWLPGVAGGFDQLHLDHTVAFLSKAFWIYTTTRDTTREGKEFSEY